MAQWRKADGAYSSKAVLVPLVFAHSVNMGEGLVNDERIVHMPFGQLECEFPAVLFSENIFMDFCWRHLGCEKGTQHIEVHNSCIKMYTFYMYLSYPWSSVPNGTEVVLRYLELLCIFK